MYITADDIEKEISLHYPIDNRNANKNVGLIRTYFIFSFYNVEKDEKIHLKNGETLRVKRGCKEIVKCGFWCKLPLFDHFCGAPMQ